MLKALVWKEIRELLPVIVVVLLIQAFQISIGLGTEFGFISEAIGYYVRPPDTIPFVDDQLCFWISLVSGIAAVAIGLWQTMWESGRGTFQFLLHRPVKRGVIISIKLLTGGTVTLLLAVLPVLYYTLWAAAPNTHASPFEWSMTAGSWQFCLLILLAYLGAFLSGLRSARWYASRFLPLVAGLLAVSLLVSACANINLVRPAIGWLIVFAGLVIVAAVFSTGIQRIARSGDFS